MSDSPTQDVLVKLEGAVRDVSEWLDMKMRTGQYSIGFVVELAQHLVAEDTMFIRSTTRLVFWRAMTGVQA
jgi:hypothetical protein